MRKFPIHIHTLHSLVGHAITDDLNIVRNTFQRDVFAKGPTYPEPKSINWKHNFKILMDSTDTIGGAGTDYPFRAPAFIPVC
jgi:hypothetical protein